MTIAASAWISACGANPTEPSGTPPPTVVLSVTVTCPSQVLVGQSLFCHAIAVLQGGGTSIIFTDGQWSSSDPSIATAAVLGLIKGRSAGQVVISTVYRGVQGSATVAVTLQDALESANAVAEQGQFKVGMTVTMWSQGFYGVESATSGQLSLRVSNQDGDVVAESPPLTVPRGGDSFVISSTFTIPAGVTRVCRTAVLKIGTLTLTSVSPAEVLRCVSVTP